MKKPVITIIAAIFLSFPSSATAADTPFSDSTDVPVLMYHAIDEVPEYGA